LIQKLQKTSHSPVSIFLRFPVSLLQLSLLSLSLLPRQLPTASLIHFFIISSTMHLQNHQSASTMPEIVIVSSSLSPLQHPSSFFCD
jgi:hypothetical protein